MSPVASWHEYSCSVTYSVLDLVGKKEYLHQHDGSCGSGGDVESKGLDAAF